LDKSNGNKALLTNFKSNLAIFIYEIFLILPLRFSQRLKKLHREKAHSHIPVYEFKTLPCCKIVRFFLNLPALE